MLATLLLQQFKCSVADVIWATTEQSRNREENRGPDKKNKRGCEKQHFPSEIRCVYVYVLWCATHLTKHKSEGFQSLASNNYNRLHFIHRYLQHFLDFVSSLCNMSSANHELHISGLSSPASTWRVFCAAGDVLLRCLSVFRSEGACILTVIRVW